MEQLIIIIISILLFTGLCYMVQEHVKEKNKKLEKAIEEINQARARLDRRMDSLKKATTALIDMLKESSPTFSSRFESILEKAEDDMKDDNEGYVSLDEYQRRNILKSKEDEQCA